MSRTAGTSTDLIELSRSLRGGGGDLSHADTRRGWKGARDVVGLLLLLLLFQPRHRSSVVIA